MALRFVILLLISYAVGGVWCLVGNNTEIVTLQSPFFSQDVCAGTSVGMSHPANEEQEYRNYRDLRDRYTNCTYVEGNLEINWLRDPTLDFSFLENIREVTGYVMIALFYSHVIPLKNLRVIRGMELYEGKYALYVGLNYRDHDHDNNFGLRELQMQSLHEILNGDVFYQHNKHLCYIQTIDWTDMRPDIKVDSDVDLPQAANCMGKTCHSTCQGGCWGPGADMCQSLTLNNCSDTCDYRCNGPFAADCCYKSCAAGCVGPSNTDCLACLHFTMDEQCVEHCPGRFKYNSVTCENEPNPDFRFSYGSSCLKQCPENLLEDGDNCVTDCGPNAIEEGNKCKPCDGTCPKSCIGFGETELLFAHHFDDDRLTNCTTITNNIFIGVSSFLGDPWEGSHPLTVDMLEVFSTVKVITGFLSIQGDHDQFRDLSMFRNLEEIKGRVLYRFEDIPTYSLYIASISLQELSLTSLRQVKFGNILINRNPQLCYAREEMWQPLLKRPKKQSVIVENNKPDQDCITDGQVCHEQCQEIGCWGPGPDQCAQCKNAQIDDTCIADCDLSGGQFVVSEAANGKPKICENCDPECQGRCYGPGPSNCTECKHVKDGPYCRPECPDLKYPSTKDNTCQPCHANCKGGRGCTGPNNNVGPKGCNMCEQVRLDADGNIIECMVANSKCKADEWWNRYSERSNASLAGVSVCRQCHPQCSGCNGEGPTKCMECRNYKLNSQCVEDCGNNQFPDPDHDHNCQNCHEQCWGCVNGTTEYDCIQCQNYEVLADVDSFFCANECPVDYPYLLGSRTCVSNCLANLWLKSVCP